MMLSFYTLWQFAKTTQDAGLHLLRAGLLRPLLRLDEVLRLYVGQI
jgi:hypothetical protein